MDNFVKNIVRSTRLKQIAAELQSYIKNEDQRRMDFYKEVTEQQKAEFINGEVVLQSPVTLTHNLVVGRLFKLLSTHVSINELGFVGLEKILIKLTRNDFEPDVCFFGKEKSKGFSAKTMFFPAPDFVAEVLSKSTEKTDRGVKKEDYALHYVKEYWIIDPEKETVEQYLLTTKEEYELNVKLNEGILHNSVVKEFSLDVKALFDDETCNRALKEMCAAAAIS